MSLIDEFGGYEKAKEYLLTLVCAKNDAYSWSRLIQEENIKQALLQYRRENNIFEVGDSVKANDNQFGFDELFKIDDFFANDDGINLAVLDDGDCYPLSWLAHATDKEIAQGHRDD